jgi:hypothetical protein
MIKNLKTIQNFPSTPDDEIEEIRDAITEIARDIEQELDLNQDKVYFTYTRPEQVKALNTPFGRITAELAENLFTKEEKENGLVDEFIKEHTIYRTIPRTIVTKLTSTESIRVLNLLFTIFKEKLEKKLEEKDR